MGSKMESIGLMLVVSVLLAIQPSTSSPFENEKLVALSERFDQMQTKMKSLEDENVQLSGRFDKLQTKVGSLEAENEALKIRVDFLERKDTENEAKIKRQGEELTQFKTKIDAKLESIQSYGPSSDEVVTVLRSSHDNKMSSIYRKGVSPDDSSTRAVVPSSCRELSLIGHTLDGLYLVKNVDTKKIETVFCDFGTSISEELIGNVDVKTEIVHFYVQRNSNFNTTNAVIPFELARLNEGGAFNLTSGVFTAPSAGIYHFDFSALKSYSTIDLAIFLQVNGKDVGIAYTNQGATGSEDVVSLSASLRLSAGDSVNLFNTYGVIFDDGNHRTHFSGWLVEEELM